MKTMMKTTVLATSLVLALSACSEKKTRDNEKTQKIQATEQMKSEELVEAGEQLVSPYTFMLSARMMDMALEKDPENKKAQFYKNFLKRFMVLKGIATRIAPLIKQGSPKQIADYEKWKKDFPNSPMKSFLLDGSEDIKTYSQLTNVLSDYNLALNDFRKFLKLNAGLQMTLNLNPHVFEKTISDEMLESCEVVNSSEKNFEVACEYSGVAQKQVNAADLIALRQVTGGEMLYWSFITAYDLSTFEKVSKDERLATMPPQEALAYYKTLPSLGKLNSKNTLSLIPEIGADFSAAIKWAKQYHTSICPKGPAARNQRRGFLMRDGVCIENATEIEKSLALIDQALGGVFSAPIKDEEGQTVDQIRVNLVGFLKNPPSDLKNLLPEQVDQDGQVTRWSDNTFHGLFPDGDIQKLAPKKN